LFLLENISSSESLRPKIDGEDNAQPGYEKIVIGTNERKKSKIDQDAKNGKNTLRRERQFVC
jgi:hypothetical protein